MNGLKQSRYQIVAALVLSVVFVLAKPVWGGGDAYEDLFQSMKARQAQVEDQLMDAGRCLGEGLNGLLKIDTACSPEARALAEAENRDRQSLFQLMATELGISAEQVGQEWAKRNLDRYRQGVQREVELSTGKTKLWDGFPPDPRKMAAPQPPQPSTPLPSDPDLFAVIEIGASGIKPAILQIIYNDVDDRYDVKEKKPSRKVETRKYDIITLDANDRGAFHRDSIKYIAQDMAAYVNSFVNDNRVPKEHIYIVGSSSVAQVDHKRELQYAVQGSTGIPMDFVTPEQEAKYVFDGVLKLIPKDRGQQDLRRTQAIVIDIGSGNTKGSYYNTSTGRIDTFEIKYGTKTFSRMVDEQRGSRGFPEAAQILRDREIRPIIRSEASRLPGLSNKQRVYLIGGIPWAVSTLLSLDSPVYAERSATHDQEIYTVMNFRAPSDVDRLYNRAIGAKAVELICTQNIDIDSITDPMKKEKRIRDINNICTGIFSIDQLIGGMEIIKAFSLELQFPDKHVFFIQNALYAWPLGYIQDRLQNIGHRS